jgi:branched-chain amino acid transport system permease protein
MNRRGLIGFLAVLLVLGAVGIGGDGIGVPSFVVILGATILFWTAQATSWNVLSGYSGYFSFGQAAYVGVGAYATADLYGRHHVNFYVSLAAAAVLSGVLALLTGAVAFRLRSLRGEIFALLTLAVPFILSAVASVNHDIDGGQGTTIPLPPFPSFLDGFPQFLFLLDAAVAVVALAVAYAIGRGRLGWGLTAVRDAEDVGEAVGVNTLGYKMAAIAISGVIGGVSGATFALQTGFVSVDGVFALTIPLYVIVMSVLGGRTHWAGPLIGALLIVTLQDRLSVLGIGQWNPIVLGGVLALLVVVAPDGLYSRLSARPWPALAGLVVPIVVGWYVPYGDLQNWVLGGMLIACLTAVLPAGWLPARWTRRRARPGTTTVVAADVVAAEVVAAEVVGTEAAATDPVSSAAVTEPATGEPLVECRGVARHYGGVRAVDDVSLTIRSGEIIGLVGPNGSGKTTLVNLLSGTVRPTRGTITIGGRDTAGLPPHRIAHLGMARTYQIPRPFDSMTVRDNVAMALMFGRDRMPLSRARDAAARHLATVALDRLADAYPAELNLHQRQLLEMARAIAAGPRVLLLDEALAGLNPAEIDNAVAVIRRIHDTGVTIVIVEHLLRVLNQLATRIVVLNRGVLLADGDPQTVMSDPAVVTAYLGRQAHV